MKDPNCDDPAVFKDDKLSIGGQVKSKGEVLKEYFHVRSKPPNLNCRVESFGRICQTFDSRRRQWVYEMGFGGLLYLCGEMHLPRQLGYWLMTRIDPFNKMLITPDGRLLRLSRNQVHWVLGIPNGSKVVPSYKTMNKVQRDKAKQITSKYGQTRKYTSSNGESRVNGCAGIPIHAQLLERLECHWEAHEEEEFKTLFLMLSLEMVLCPTLSPRLSSDLVPALTCAMDAADYDWCTLVLTKLLGSVRSFGRRFYSKGHAGGCGGCTLFALIFYLDRLDREAVEWGVFPRIKVWNIKLIGIASKEDRLMAGGDYGKTGTLDVAYGENHPRQARDTDGPKKVELHDDMECLAPRRRRGASRTNIQQNTGEDLSVEGDPHIVELPHIHSPSSGGVASYGQSFLEAMCRFLSKDAISLFRRLTSPLFSTWPRLGGYPLLGDVIAFPGGGYELRELLLPSVVNFMKNPSCRVFAVVSEVVIPTVHIRDPVFVRMCIALKSADPSRVTLFHGDSVAPNISIDYTQLISFEQVFDDIFKCCMRGICESKLSQNKLLLERSLV